eukprot:1495852-Rhodomonas_salina.1
MGRRGSRGSEPGHVRAAAGHLTPLPTRVLSGTEPARTMRCTETACAVHCTVRAEGVGGGESSTQRTPSPVGSGYFRLLCSDAAKSNTSNHTTSTLCTRHAVVWI